MFLQSPWFLSRVSHPFRPLLGDLLGAFLVSCAPSWSLVRWATLSAATVVHAHGPSRRQTALGSIRSAAPSCWAPVARVQPIDRHFPSLHFQQIASKFLCAVAQPIPPAFPFAVSSSWPLRVKSSVVFCSFCSSVRLLL